MARVQRAVKIGAPDLRPPLAVQVVEEFGEPGDQVGFGEDGVYQRPRAEPLKDGVLVVVSGPPNAGKSSLINAIVGEERVIVTDVRGERPSAPLTVEANVAWAGYANENIRTQIEPLLQAALVRRGLL